MDSNDNLIDKIDEVKRKITEFESNLNINSIDIDKVVLDNQSELVDKIESYKKRINDIEEDVAKNSNIPTLNDEPLLTSKKKEDITSMPSKTKEYSAYNDIKKTINRVEIEKQEVENINDLLDKLKKNTAEQRKAVATTETSMGQNEVNLKSEVVNKVNKNDMPNHVNISSIKDNKAKQLEKQDKAKNVAPNNVNITENDLHSMSELISKLDELLRSNKELSEKLNELLKENNINESKSNKSSELIKRLAMLGSNGNLN